MNNRQEDRRAALVTGASYGVGAATALALACNGFDIAVTATRLSNLDRTSAAVEELGAAVIALELDLDSQESIETVVSEATSRLGGLDVLVNNAGAHGQKPAIEITRADWDAIVPTNLAGTFFLTQAFARGLIDDGRQGSVINITSTHAMRGVADRVLYGVSKAALNHMTKMLAVEWGPHGIRVNAIAPGRMLTEAPSRQASASAPGYIEGMLKRTPLRRLATAEEVAAAVAYLSSDSAASVTGQILTIDGGITL